MHSIMWHSSLNCSHRAALQTPWLSKRNSGTLVHLEWDQPVPHFFALMESLRTCLWVKSSEVRCICKKYHIQIHICCQILNSKWKCQILSGNCLCNEIFFIVVKHGFCFVNKCIWNRALYLMVHANTSPFYGCCGFPPLQLTACDHIYSPNVFYRAKG